MTSPCPECGLDYVTPSSNDRQKHRRIHDARLNGLPRKPHHNDEVVCASGLDRVLVVTPGSPMEQRRRAQDTSLLMRREVEGMDVTYCRNEKPDERDLHIFLGSRSDRLVAYLVLERREHIWRCTWSQYENDDARKIADRPWMWSVGIAWVCLSNRRQGWIRRLIAAASAHLEIAPGEYGWYTPLSPDGEAMVRALHPEFFYIAK